MLKVQDIHVLIVDDEELIQYIFQQALQQWGYQVDIAANGREALQKCREGNYHIVITDLNMPEMDGITLLKKIKDQWPYIDVIVVTGYPTIETAIEAMKVGAYDFILKPVNFDQVKFILQKCYRKICAQAENAELREINAQLRELNELKNKFLAITNHEIRTPLTILKGYLEILEMLVEPKDAEIQEIFQVLNTTIKELQGTTDRMHMLSLLHQGNWLGEPEEVDLNEIVREVGSIMDRMFRSRGISFRIDLRAARIPLVAPKMALQVLIRELLHNALKFTPDEGNVELTVWDLPEYVLIRVKDSGIGIPIEKQQLIFREFYEVQDTNNHKSSHEEFMGGGMGIGLALVKEILTALKGKIEVESEPGVGSTFFVRLPKKGVSPGSQPMKDRNGTALQQVR